MRNYLKVAGVIALLWLTASCSKEVPAKYDWDTYEVKRSLIWSPYGPYEIPGKLVIVKDKTEIEMLDMAADVASKATDDALYYLLYSKREGTGEQAKKTKKEKSKNWAITKTNYQIDSKEGSTTKTYLSINEGTELLEGTTEKEALDMVEDATRHNKNIKFMVTSARLRELSDDEYKALKAQGDTGWKKIK